MPSSARQRIIVLNRKNGNSRGTVFLIRKTGYVNLTINGRPFYYNYEGKIPMTQKIDLDKIVEEQQQKQQQKQTIIISKKSG